MKQDLFIKNMKYVRILAIRLCKHFGNKFDIDELISESWVSFDKYIKKYPERYDKLNNNRALFLSVVKGDIYDYVKKENKWRITTDIPEFYSFEIFKKDDNDSIDICFYKHHGFRQVDNNDYLHAILDKSLKSKNKQVSLTDTEWAVIQGYFYDEKTLKEVGQDIGIAECSVCSNKNKLLKKLKLCSKGI